VVCDDVMADAAEQSTPHNTDNGVVWLVYFVVYKNMPVCLLSMITVKKSQLTVTSFAPF